MWCLARETPEEAHGLFGVILSLSSRAWCVCHSTSLSGLVCVGVFTSLSGGGGAPFLPYSPSTDTPDDFLCSQHEYNVLPRFYYCTRRCVVASIFFVMYSIFAKKNSFLERQLHRNIVLNDGR